MLSKLFGFDPSKHNIKTEVMAGITTFLTMAYILAVNPSIFSNLADKGMDTNAVFTATALAAIIGTLAMAIYAKKPFGLAPGMGLNAFFVFTVCLTMGYSWQFALTAILIEGFIFVVLTLTKVRTLIVDAIPASVKRAIGAGIGLFIAFIGLKNAGIIVSNEATFVGLGDFTPTAILGWIAIVLSAVLMTRRVKGSLFYGIIAATLIGIPLGVTQVESGWIPVSLPKSVAPTFLQFDFTSLLNIKTVLVVISLLLVNIFDTVGTLVGLCYKTGNVRPDGSIPHVSEAMMSDAIGTTCGAMLGSSTITTYVESASGIAEGGRSGLTSFVTGLLFLVALFLAPLFLLIPSAATSGALVIVGVLMLDGIKHIEMTDMSEAFPSFVTVIMMLLCYSIADGVCFGILTFVLTKLLTGKWRDLNITLVVLAVLFVLNFVFG